MPFQEFSIMSQREELCRLAMMPGANMRGLARRFGVSPETAYKWLGRYRAEGAAGLSDRSRCPKASPRRTAAEMEGKVLALRAEHPCWGGRKLHTLLGQAGLEEVPSPSTITATPSMPTTETRLPPARIRLPRLSWRKTSPTVALSASSHA
eukprot:gene8121-10330_t